MAEFELENIQERDRFELREGEDFNFENGLLVFTEKYLRTRRYCCGNNCRHCPYGHINLLAHNK